MKRDGDAVGDVHRVVVVERRVGELPRGLDVGADAVKDKAGATEVARESRVVGRVAFDDGPGVARDGDAVGDRCSRAAPIEGQECNGDGSGGSDAHDELVVSVAQSRMHWPRISTNV